MKTTSFLVAGLVGSASAFSAEQVDRRNLLKKSLSSAAALVVGGNLINADPANAAYSQTYLTEPTDEFKANEEKAMAFKRAQLAQKKAMSDVLTRLTTVSSKEEELVNDLKELRYLVIKGGGMPAGLKKDDLVKQVRSKKAKGFWPTAVEYEYQGLIREIAFQQSPNKEKDDQNPM
mmetsp:Transcript_30350/g.71039  ORF Transcript_30350/g.71039 Transcript_30350/m.71039 type:complete len:176 (-) Transcript_30350:91-618(-)|eukprot:CAMPEP_0185811360 /NCGR_PEP_ID=MMETSP1322-20130828/7963_1 /TAXON_ID=265543 /ORGANISM="Minutocellus polymorphus, Strain RCC2270" /LENGTH=175 /DNA_ID=CAMNT_0028507791 /DNA_START=49 /DNA_END=576 /DNA_ORIENTATION=-